ncbi:MAG: DUF2569 family protein [Acidimicrobiales bacterium]
MGSVAAANNDEGSASRPSASSGLRGWLLLYIFGLVIQALHGLGLSVGAVVIYANPARAGLTSFVPVGALLFYVGANVALAIYTLVVLALMIRRRKAAIVNSVILNCLTVLALISWHFLGEKSPLGTVVDSLPSLVGIAYILRSRRVRRTFICPPVAAHSPSAAPSS